MSWDSYNVQRLIDQVGRLLQENGVQIDQDADPKRQRQGAADLLSGLGVTPTLSPEHTLDLNGHVTYNTRVHGD